MSPRVWIALGLGSLAKWIGSDAYYVALLERALGKDEADRRIAE